MNNDADRPVRGGDQGPVVFERYRAYLVFLARRTIDPWLKAKVDASDIVQETLLDAWKGRDELRGQGEVAVMAWLRRILANNLRDLERRYAGPEHNARRERSLEAAMDENSSRLGEWLAADQTPPGRRADLNEQIVGLASALAQLPPTQQRAIELRHFENLAHEDIAREMGLSGPGAVHGLLDRGRRRLRELLAREDGIP